MTVEQVLKILYPGVKGLLNKSQSVNLVLSLILLAIDPIDGPTLRFLARFFTPPDYDDLVDERTIALRCGYPLCVKSLKESLVPASQRLKNPIHPWTDHYCSKHCWQASMFYRKQLSHEVLMTREDVAYTPFGYSKYETNIIILEEAEEIARVENRTLSEVIADMVKRESRAENLISNLHI